MIRLVVCVVLLAFAISARAEPAKAFKIIVNARGPLESLKRGDVEALFLKKTTRVKDVAVTPFDLPLESATRQRFSETIMQRSARAVHSYWQQRLFSGQGIAPKELKDDSAVIAAVAAGVGGIAYVAAEAPLPDTVKAISVAD